MTFIGDAKNATTEELEALGKDHIETARAYNNIGNALAAQSDYEGALIEFRKALDIRMRLLGTSHPQVALVRRNIAFALNEIKEYDLLGFRLKVTDEMIADFLTKPLQGVKFRKFRKAIALYRLLF